MISAKIKRKNNMEKFCGNCEKYVETRREKRYETYQVNNKNVTVRIKADICNVCNEVLFNEARDNRIIKRLLNRTDIKDNILQCLLLLCASIFVYMWLYLFWIWLIVAAIWSIFSTRQILLAAKNKQQGKITYIVGSIAINFVCWGVCIPIYVVNKIRGKI